MKLSDEIKRVEGEEEGEEEEEEEWRRIKIAKEKSLLGRASLLKDFDILFHLRNIQKYTSQICKNGCPMCTTLGAYIRTRFFFAWYGVSFEVAVLPTLKKKYYNDFVFLYLKKKLYKG